MNEKLIEEAAKAILNAMGGIVPDELEQMHEEAARAALAVFEKAQGEPSDALTHEPTPEAIEAARLAYQEAYEADYDSEDCIAFALRAAFAVGEGEVQ